MKVYISPKSQHIVKSTNPDAVKYYRGEQVDKLINDVRMAQALMSHISEHGFATTNVIKLKKYLAAASNMTYRIEGRVKDEQH